LSFSHNYKNRKDHRKPYRGAKSVDSMCKNHGECPYCKENRLKSSRLNQQKCHEQIKDFEEEK
jgi:hypothetical protein